MNKLTHIDESGAARMVDVTHKDVTQREAIAEGEILMSRKIIEMIVDGKAPKGNVLETARIAGIMAAKRTWDLIPLCHPLEITGVDVRFKVEEDRIKVESQVSVPGRTGVEMEALTAVSVALLTIYDMCKAVDKRMVISDIKLMRKSGGKSGSFVREV